MSADKQLLEKKLWDIANDLRGNMAANEFMNYILGFIFYKFLSENIELVMNRELSGDNISFEEACKDSDLKQGLTEEALDNLGYFLEPEFLFTHFVERAVKEDEDIISDLGRAFQKVQDSTLGQDSEEEFKGLFEDVDLSSSKLGKTPKAKSQLIGKILRHISEIDINFAECDADLLGDAYEYLIGKFAAGAGKSAGEFYTPQQVSKILSKIVSDGKERLKSVYDPTCGSGSLLLRVAKETTVEKFYGQELNSTTYNLARMNMILHRIKYENFDIKQEDTLKEPQHMDHEGFEAVVANPPFSAKWEATEQYLSDDRFAQYGRLAPKGKADYAFLQHMIYHLADNGTMAIVLPHGVLFRGAAEGVIRKYLVEDKNYLDAVIGLPANIFFGTGIPTVILVFKKCRENSEDVLFIDASKNFEKAKNQNVLRDEDVEKIVTTLTNREEIEKFSHRATMAEIEENDYNLNIPRYVDTFEEEEPVDLDAVVEELGTLEKEITAVDSAIVAQCKEMGIKAPIFGGDYE